MSGKRRASERGQTTVEYVAVAAVAVVLAISIAVIVFTSIIDEAIAGIASRFSSIP
jgi:hypothetical protein